MEKPVGKPVEEIIEEFTGLDSRGYGVLEYVQLLFEMYHYREFYGERYKEALIEEIQLNYQKIMTGFEIIKQESMEPVVLKVLIPRQKTEKFSLDDIEQ